MEASKSLERTVNKVANWTMWHATLNETQTVQINFTNERITLNPIYFNGSHIRNVNTADITLLSDFATILDLRLSIMGLYNQL